jgi:hypothetical protein
VLKQISEAVGLLAAAVGTVYLLGALVIVLRLQTNDFPTLAVISNLPRELVISHGLTYAVVPWLVAATVVAIYWLARQKAPSGLAARQPVLWHWRLRLGLLVGLVVLTVLVVWLTLRELGGDFTRWDKLALEIAVVAVAMVVFALWRALAWRYGREWSTPAAVAVAAALTGLLIVPAGVEIGVRAPLAEAQLCVEGPTHLSGLLLGEAGDRVYIGQNVDPRRIVSAPKTGELYVGPQATEDFLCRGERALLPTADQLIAAAFLENPCAKCVGRVSRLSVSGRQPRFAAATVGGYREGEQVFIEPILFRRAETDWRVVSVLSGYPEGCGALEDSTGVETGVLQDLGVC